MKPRFDYNLGEMQSKFEAIHETMGELIPRLRNYLYATSREAQTSTSTMVDEELTSDSVAGILAAGSALRLRVQETNADLSHLIARLGPEVDAYIDEYEKYSEEAEFFFYDLYTSLGGDMPLEEFQEIRNEDDLNALLSKFPSLKEAADELAMLDNVQQAINAAVSGGNTDGVVVYDKNTGKSVVYKSIEEAVAADPEIGVAIESKRQEQVAAKINEIMGSLGKSGLPKYDA